MADDTAIWGPSGPRLFDSSDAQAPSRVGVVDVGSNSVRLVVFDGPGRSPAYFFNEKLMCGLGRGVSETGRLHPEGRVRAIAALRRFALLADGMGVDALVSVATAAVREASDGEDFVDEVRRTSGIEIHVIRGEDEARLSAQGVMLGWPGARGLVCDVGGSSMEMAELDDGVVGKRLSVPLGPFRLAEVKPGKLDAYIAGIVKDVVKEMGPAPERLFLVGGSWRAIARLDMERRDYPLTVLHEYRMTVKSVADTVAWILGNDIEDLRRRVGLGEARMSLLPLAARVLGTLIEGLRPHDIAISGYGIREGLLFEKMPPELRARDPLIDACRFAERREARIPGFGDKLYRFVLPLFGDAPAAELRIVRAACLLHDVSWRAHPDYRYEVCFDNATRANLGGLTHEERVFLGLSLLHRYKGSRDGKFDDVVALLAPDRMIRAEVLGRAMRLGAMFTVDDPAAVGELRWDPDAKRLEIRIDPRAEALFGEVAVSRFHALAGAMGARPEIVLP